MKRKRRAEQYTVTSILYKTELGEKRKQAEGKQRKRKESAVKNSTRKEPL